MYCGLALHHAKLYDKIRRSEQKYKVNGQIYSHLYLAKYKFLLTSLERFVESNCVKVALEVLSYHNAASCEEVEMICGEDPPKPEDNRDLAT